MTLASVSAQNDHMTLLAVSELANGSLVGGTADLSLEVRSGTGRVFIDSKPLSKFDTQLSIRFAKDTACKLAEVNCNNLDFLYTIRSGSQFVGGPSAGAAITTLTYAKIKDLNVRNNIAMTGTINSGRLIGNVGGVKEKIEGAGRGGIKVVLIPSGEKTVTEDNVTLDLVKYGSIFGVEVIPISDIEEAIYYVTGHEIEKPESNFIVNEQYSQIMQKVSADLCSRSKEIIDLIEESDFVIDNTSYRGEPINQTFASALDLLENANESLQQEAYYSASSECFGANINLYYVYLISQNLSDDYYKNRLTLLSEAIDLFEKNLTSSEYETIPALQTAMIVRQRLEEAQRYVQNARLYFNEDDEKEDEEIVLESNDIISSEEILNTLNNKTNETEIQLPSISRAQGIMFVALAVERLKTTSSWSTFFSLEGESYQIDADSLKSSCEGIVDDALSRIQYSRVYIPDSFSVQEQELQNASLKKDPIFCIAKASQIRADVNAIIGTLGVTQETLNELIERKLSKASEVLASEAANNRFPILGYSYFEYAQTLSERDPASSILYAEYALELSDLDLYFERYDVYENQNPTFKKKTVIEIEVFIVFVILSVLIGFVFGVVSVKNYVKKQNNEKPKPKRTKKKVTSKKAKKRT